MAHPWDQFVLGGTDRPRIMLVGENMCSNPNIDYSVPASGDWQESSASILTQYSSEFSYGEYMAKIAYAASVTSKYASYTYDTGAAILNKRFLLAARVKSSIDFALSFAGSSQFGYTEFVGSEEVQTIFITATAAGQTGNYLSVRIYASTSELDANLLFDNVYFTEIYGNYLFFQPNSSELTFEKSVIGESELWNGKRIEYNKRWLPVYTANWEYMGAGYEIWRQNISENAVLFCIPHDDISWGFFGMWDGNFDRRYPFDRFIGHTGTIVIRGIELLTEKPNKQSGNGILYFED